METKPQQDTHSGYYRNKTIPSGDISFVCTAKDGPYDPWKNPKETWKTIIGTLHLINDKEAKIKYDKNFTLPSGCCYLLEQLMIQDVKPNPEQYKKSRGDED